MTVGQQLNRILSKRINLAYPCEVLTCTMSALCSHRPWCYGHAPIWAGDLPDHYHCADECHDTDCVYGCHG